MLVTRLPIHGTTWSQEPNVRFAQGGPGNAAIDGEIAGADAVKELRLVQERLDLEAELATMGATVDMSALEAEFIKVAKAYGERTGVSHAAWRAVGIPPAVLKAAGISRGA